MRILRFVISLRIMREYRDYVITRVREYVRAWIARVLLLILTLISLSVKLVFLGYHDEPFACFIWFSLFSYGLAQGEP